VATWGAAVALALAGGVVPLHGQDLADFDYENLSFRGIGIEAGRIFPTRVDSDFSLGLRLDMGYLGPGLRITPTVSYWSSRMKEVEVRELELRLNELIDTQGPPAAPEADVDLGQIDWSDLSLGVDAHLVWSVPFGVLTYLGAGAAAHIMNGDGSAIAGTFIEDLLDTVTAGFNVHTGLELPLDNFRLYGTVRYEIMGDLRYGEVRLGTAYMWGPSAPGER
jgi:hypothetical protein